MSKCYYRNFNTDLIQHEIHTTDEIPVVAFGHRKSPQEVEVKFYEPLDPVYEEPSNVSYLSLLENGIQELHAMLPDLEENDTTYEEWLDTLNLLRKEYNDVISTG